MQSRRQFLKHTSAALVYGAIAAPSRAAHANPLGLPLGLQLYSVREQMAADFDGTLSQVASAGYKEVEAAGFFNRSAPEVRSALDKAGLRCPSSHVPFAQLRDDLDQVVAFHKVIGAEVIICPSPGMRTPATKLNTMTLDDWRWAAEQFNLIGTKVNAAGLRFGYHNHFTEFGPKDGGVPYYELLRLTDASKVTFELDCGWAVVGGVSPIEIFRRYPDRISMLHVKDFKLSATEKPTRQNSTVTELGRGNIDYGPILRQAAKSEKIRHIFVEQEAFDMPYMLSLKVDADYMRNLKV